MSCQDKLHPALDLWHIIRIHGIRLHGIELLNISGNNSYLFLPIRMTKPKDKQIKALHEEAAEA
jgi:hypothetical protein